MKLKITKYLRRAEEIFTCHLQKTLGGGAGPGTVRRPLPKGLRALWGGRRERGPPPPTGQRAVTSCPGLCACQGQGCLPAILLAPSVSHTQLVPSSSNP